MIGKEIGKDNISKKTNQIIPEGKLSIEQLEDLVFAYTERTSLQSGPVQVTLPQIGQDCAVIHPGNQLISVSSDPITGATKTIGKLAISVNLNDIASSGGTPFGVMITLLCPIGTVEEEVRQVMEDVTKEAERFDIAIMGGHTEITDAVTRMVISITALGYVDPLYRPDPVRESMNIYMTKDAGLEGSLIISKEKAMELKEILVPSDIQTLEEYENNLLVLEEAKLAKKYNASLMHDITEGGVLGAIWEICAGIKKGALIQQDQIPISVTTEKIASHYDIDPLRLISSGSLVFCCQPEHHQALTDDFKRAGIQLSKVGHITESPEILMQTGDKIIPIAPPVSDELYKVLVKKS